MASKKVDELKEKVLGFLDKWKEELIIIDETSMIDTILLDALLKGIKKDVKLF